MRTPEGPCEGLHRVLDMVLVLVTPPYQPRNYESIFFTGKGTYKTCTYISSRKLREKLDALYSLS